MVWPSLGSRTAKEQNGTDQKADIITDLSTAAELAGHGASDGVVNVCTVKDNERSVASQFH